MKKKVTVTIQHFMNNWNCTEDCKVQCVCLCSRVNMKNLHVFFFQIYFFFIFNYKQFETLPRINFFLCSLGSWQWRHVDICNRWMLSITIYIYIAFTCAIFIRACPKIWISRSIGFLHFMYCGSRFFLTYLMGKTYKTPPQS